MSSDKKIPLHVAIIMDGNGRWARKRGLPRVAGHKIGADRLRKIIGEAKDMGIGIMTMFAFSTENWSRPKEEIEFIFGSLKSFLEKEVPDFCKRGIRLKFIGERSSLPADLVRGMENAEAATKDNSSFTLVLAFNYGSRKEILHAAKEYGRRLQEGSISEEAFDEKKFSSFLYTSDIPDPDLLIRTSGEIRISNFLLWQLSYTELYFTEKNWPEFGKKELAEAVKAYAMRQRRFGAV